MSDADGTPGREPRSVAASFSWRWRSFLWCHLYLEHSQSVEYFACQFCFTSHQVLNSIVSYKKNEQGQQAEIHLNIFAVREHESILYMVHVRASSAVIIASVVETTQRPLAAH